MHDQSNHDSNFVEINNSNVALHKIATLYADQLMSDICLVVGEKRYPAHRVILCASSEVFQVMLMNPEWNECRESVIELKEDPVCSLVFPQFLQYLYVGQIRVSLKTVMPMLALADKYNITDLVQLCVDYMLKHVSNAGAEGYLISWLQYTLSLSPYHKEVTEALQKFLKNNIDTVAESSDFNDLDVNILILLLQQNDLVLESEFKLLGYLENWILHKKDELNKELSFNEEDKYNHFISLYEAVIIHVRFAMMTVKELVELSLGQLCNLHKEFFVSRIAIGMSYHSGHIEQTEKIRCTESGALQFTPRLYKKDIWGLSMTVNDFERIEDFQSIAANFFSQSNLSEKHEDSSIGWELDFFPRGIRYNKAKLINIYGLTSNCLEIPETILKTVRLRVTCRELLETEQCFKIGVLITGVQNSIPHVKTVHVRTHYFSDEDRVLNIDSLLPYEELLLSSVKLSPHLIGPNRNTLSIQVIIAPMGCFISHDSPPFEFK